MFSRIYDSARNIFTRSPLNDQEPVLDSPKITERPTQRSNADMVTTRRGQSYQIDSPAAPASVTRSGLKRSLEEPGTPVSASKKKRAAAPKRAAKASPTQEKGAEGDKVAVTLQAELSQNRNADESEDRVGEDGEATPKATAPARQSSPSVVIELPTRGKDGSEAQDGPADASENEGTESVYGTPMTNGTSSVYATPATHLNKRTASSKPARGSVPKSSQEIPTPSGPPRVSRPQTKHIRFGSEEPPATIPEEANEVPDVASSARQQVDDSEESESSDDDEAPEAVTQASALQQIKAAEAEAQRAAANQEAARREKRKARDAFLKEQAAAAKAKKQKPSSPSRLSEADSEEDSDEEEAASPGLRPSARPQPTALPALLPLSLLEQEAPAPRAASPATAAAAAPTTKAKHLKFADEKPIKDRKAGPVSVRVLAKANALLAPKVERGGTMQVRERWLKGRLQEKRRAGKGKGGGKFDGRLERREFGVKAKGFLRR